jgi:hypothetical protein
MALKKFQMQFQRMPPKIFIKDSFERSQEEEASEAKTSSMI